MQFIKGVGPKRAALFSHLGIVTVGDALYFFPRRYEDRRRIKKVGQVSIGLKETVLGRVVSREVKYTPRRRGRLFEVTIEDDSGSLCGLWFNFNQAYMKRRFDVGKEFIFHGEIRWDGLRLVIYHPEVEEYQAADRSLHFGRIVPIYPLTESLSQRQTRQVLYRVVRDYAGEAEDHLPGYLKEKFHLPDLQESLQQIHFPSDPVDVSAFNEKRSRWHKRLIFEEFFFLEVLLAKLKVEREKARQDFRIEDRKEYLKIFLRGLPYDLTGAQKRAFREIKKDMLSPHPMYRLLQGDVGCGKTVVTAMAVLLAADNGLQSAVMAPTEILARQHFETLSGFLKGLPPEVTLMTSGLGPAERKEARKKSAEGSAAVVVGTHALIQEGVEFSRLGLVVIDEQHRFGVSHRLLLREKGDNPDTLVVTATPIPRTLAMTFYGDMDVSVIDEMPAGRRPAETRVLEEEDRQTLYGLIKERLEEGQQAFIIYPLVEESERLELKAAEEMATHLAENVFPRHRIGLIHGRMSSARKKEVMDDFQAGCIHLLVSTTVVEVGVDIPRATVMVVEHAERFGLAQLHQLRGRVGRRGQKALCILVISQGAAEESRYRLETMARISDGFQLAEEDLKHRGPGEMAGLKQSGDPDFLLANLIRHRKALEFAREEAFQVVRGRFVAKYELTKLLQIAKIKWGRRIRYLSSG